MENLSQDRVLLNVDTKPSVTKSPNELQVSGGGKQTRRRRSNEPYSPSGKHLHSPDATLRTDDSISPAVTPSSQMSRSLKSISVPSSPATDVSFELPSEDIVLKGRVSSLSLGANEGTNVDLTISNDDDIVDDDDDDQTPLIASQARIIQSQSKLTKRQHYQQQHHKPRTKPHKALEESIPLLAEPLLRDEDDEQHYGTVEGTGRNPSEDSSWSLRSFFGYLVSLGSGIGNLLWFYVTRFFRGRGNQNNSRIN